MEEVHVEVIWINRDSHYHVRLRRKQDGKVVIVFKDPVSLSEEEVEYDEFVNKQPEIIRRAFDNAYLNLMTS